jgi:hypothetical protein
LFKRVQKRLRKENLTANSSYIEYLRELGIGVWQAHSGLRLVESQRKPPKQVFFTVIALKNPVIGRNLPLDLKNNEKFS